MDLKWIRGTRKAIERTPHLLTGQRLAEDPEITVWTQDFGAARKALHNVEFYSNVLCKAWSRLAETQREFVKDFGVIYDPIGDESLQSVAETPQNLLDRIKSALDRLTPAAHAIEALANEQSTKLKEHLDSASLSLKNIERLITKRGHKKIDYERCLRSYERDEQKAPDNAKKAERELEEAKMVFLKYDDLVKQRIPDFLAIFDTFLSTTVARLSRTTLQIYDQWRTVTVELMDVFQLRPESYDEIKSAWVEQFMAIMPAVEALDIVRDGRSTQLSEGISSPPKTPSSLPKSPKSPRRAANSTAAKFAAIPSSIPNFYQNASSHFQVHNITLYSKDKGMFGDPLESFKHALHHDKVRARYDFDGEHEGDLSFKKGDIITIHDHGTVDDKNWWKGDVHGKVGLFPKNYVESVDPAEPAQKTEESHKKVEGFQEYVPKGNDAAHGQETPSHEGKTEKPQLGDHRENEEAKDTPAASRLVPRLPSRPEHEQETIAATAGAAGATAGAAAAASDNPAVSPITSSSKDTHMTTDVNDAAIKSPKLDKGTIRVVQPEPSTSSETKNPETPASSEAEDRKLSVPFDFGEYEDAGSTRRRSIFMEDENEDYVHESPDVVSAPSPARQTDEKKVETSTPVPTEETSERTPVPLTTEETSDKTPAPFAADEASEKTSALPAKEETSATKEGSDSKDVPPSPAAKETSKNTDVPALSTTTETGKDADTGSNEADEEPLASKDTKVTEDAASNGTTAKAELKEEENPSQEQDAVSLPQETSSGQETNDQDSRVEAPSTTEITEPHDPVTPKKSQTSGLGIENLAITEADVEEAASDQNSGPKAGSSDSENLSGPRSPMPGSFPRGDAELL